MGPVYAVPGVELVAWLGYCRDDGFPLGIGFLAVFDALNVWRGDNGLTIIVAGDGWRLLADFDERVLLDYPSSGVLTYRPVLASIEDAVCAGELLHHGVCNVEEPFGHFARFSLGCLPGFPHCL